MLPVDDRTRMFRWLRFPALIAALALLPLNWWLTVSADDGYRKVDDSCRLVFPDDHAAHRDFKTEWWYYTGNLQNADGRDFGFQLTFFRTALRPPDSKSETVPRSAWRTSQIFIAHAAVTDVSRRTHHSAQTTAREALDLAGAGKKQGAVTVHARNWHSRIAPGGHRIRADGNRFSIDLALTPEKNPVRHGRKGYSRKGSGRDRASCYYSFTRLAASGRIRVDDRTEQVRGTAWMDHEFSTAPLEPGLAGWDWFSLQFSDRTELMVYLLRRPDGTFHPASSGTFVRADGTAIFLHSDLLNVKFLERWKSPATGAVYPIRWRIFADRAKLDLTVRARVADQEMDARKTTGVVYWEGSVAAEGTASGRPVSGLGYVEMTGYDRAFDAPL